MKLSILYFMSVLLVSAGLVSCSESRLLPSNSEPGFSNGTADRTFEISQADYIRAWCRTEDLGVSIQIRSPRNDLDIMAALISAPTDIYSGVSFVPLTGTETEVEVQLIGSGIELTVSKDERQRIAGKFPGTVKFSNPTVQELAVYCRQLY